MGLDISFYASVKVDPNPPADTDEQRIVSNNDSFAARAAPFKEGDHFTTDGTTARYSSAYSSYSRVRDILCRKILGMPAEDLWKDKVKRDEPGFAEMVNFTDCDGFMGPEACARVSAALATLPEDWIAAQEDWDQQCIRRLVAGFAVAANGGCAEYH